MSHGEAQKPNVSCPGRIWTSCVTLVTCGEHPWTCQVLGVGRSYKWDVSPPAVVFSISNRLIFPSTRLSLSQENLGDIKFIFHFCFFLFLSYGFYWQERRKFADIFMLRRLRRLLWGRVMAKNGDISLPLLVSRDSFSVYWIHNPDEFHF